MVSERMRRVVTYERVSSEDQRERETIRTQTAELARRLQQEPGVELVDRYVDDGVHELALEKIKSLIELKYNTISDAAREIGSTAAIRELFIGFQHHLYDVVTAEL
ncbi:MAG: hypothetical protein IIB69_12785 [Proteobacteria bacterium]|nr:hypothetical protein [Pseudomonadota bacterium]